MDTDRKWVVVRIDGKIASVSTDYKALADITARIAAQKSPAYDRICAETVDFDHVWELRRSTAWEDLMLFGTDFQKKVWRKLFDLTHTTDESDAPGDQAETGDNEEKEYTGKKTSKARLISYSDFAEMCQNKAGVRAVAHAIGLNPVSVIIPCHLVIPKESIDKIADIRRKAESTIFKGDDICMDSLLRDKGFDFGKYALGRKLKRRLIQLELG
ncbi:MAG: methylated-DNA--[Bacteroidales bacterium]|nr:methylated-DNA--[protein]-cysteine S-methyltransferase [Bacteroidales bacterium]